MTQETYHVEREGVDKDKKKEDEDKKKKKSVAFKASSSSKNKGKSKKESGDDEDLSDIDDETMALFMRKMGKFMKKKSYGAKKRRDHNKEYVRRCYKCKSPDHVGSVPTIVTIMRMRRSIRRRRRKKEKKEKKMTFQKKKGEDYVVT
jgi:hypothetical protein